MKSPSSLPGYPRPGATLAKTPSRKTHHGHELAPGLAREPALAGNRLIDHPRLLHCLRAAGGAPYPLGRPVLAVGRALFQLAAQLAPVAGLRLAAGADAVLGAPERIVLILVQRLLQRPAGPGPDRVLVPARGVRGAGEHPCPAFVVHLLCYPGVQHPLAGVAHRAPDRRLDARRCLLPWAVSRRTGGQPRPAYRAGCECLRHRLGVAGAGGCRRRWRWPASKSPGRWCSPCTFMC